MENGKERKEEFGFKCAIEEKKKREDRTEKRVRNIKSGGKMKKENKEEGMISQQGKEKIKKF